CRKFGSQLACHRPELDNAAHVVRMLNRVQNYHLAKIRKADEVGLVYAKVSANRFQIIDVVLQADPGLVRYRVRESAIAHVIKDDRAPLRQPLKIPEKK